MGTCVGNARRIVFATSTFARIIISAMVSWTSRSVHDAGEEHTSRQRNTTSVRSTQERTSTQRQHRAIQRGVHRRGMQRTIGRLDGIGQAVAFHRET